MVTLKPASKRERERKGEVVVLVEGVKRERYRKHAVPMVTQKEGS